MRSGSEGKDKYKDIKPFRSPKSPLPLRPGRCFLFMKQKAKILEINVTADELQDIRNAYEQMIEKTDLQTMAGALHLLNSEDSPESVKDLKEELEKCYKEIMESWGPTNADGSLDIDMVDYPSAGAGSPLGFILKLYFNQDKESWIWTLNADIASNYVYPIEEPIDED